MLKRRIVQRKAVPAGLPSCVCVYVFVCVSSTASSNAWLVPTGLPS